MTQDVRSGPGDLAPGDQVAGYEIQAQIGRGGMAVVYRALDLRLGRPVALKVLAPELGEDQAFRQRFIRESRALAGVDHPHIIPVFDAGESAGVLFIAMRYVSGGDVRSLIEADGILSPSRAAEIATQVASALDAAHAHGLVHRDVKPGNMLLGQASSSGHDHVYLSDFGLSKHSLTPSTLTSTGQFLGTLDYVSPEQIQGHPVDGRADQYALACTVVEMLTGTPPFQRNDTMALMWAQLQAAPPRLTERRPELPPVIDQVIGRALAKSPADRFPSCRAFAEALTAACAVVAERPRPPSAPADPVPARPAENPWPRRSPPERPAADWLAAAGSGVDETQTAGAGWGGPSAAGKGVPPRASRSPAGEPELARNFLTPGTPGADSWSRQPQPSAPADYQQGTWPAQPSRVSSGRGRPARHTGRSVTIALLVVLFVAGVAGAVAYRLAHRTDSATPPAAATTTVTVPPPGPATIVRDFFTAINHQRYFVAWGLTAKTEPYAKFAAGYAGTERDAVTIESVSGNIVTARLAAVQTSGIVKHYEGTYTITNGRISSADVQQIS
ncbi:MAG: protein kinase [Streptosporangiaceae bacterium]